MSKSSALARAVLGELEKDGLVDPKAANQFLERVDEDGNTYVDPEEIKKEVNKRLGEKQIEQAARGVLQ
jgi:ribosomal protein S19E (S16A)